MNKSRDCVLQMLFIYRTRNTKYIIYTQEKQKTQVSYDKTEL